MRILFIGDIVGRPGRRGVAKWLPGLREEHQVDFVVANAENAAGGLGATPKVLRELAGYGVQAFTMGNHVWRKNELIGAAEALEDMVRPANYPEGTPGRGSRVFEDAAGRKLGVLSVLGRVFLDPMECPFRAADREIARLREETPLILVDCHAEATSEKVAMGWHLDGRCTAVLGTHTHIATADEWVMPGGTAYITDVGMCGPIESILGVVCDKVIERYITGMPRRFEVAKGPAMFNAVLVDADEETGHARGIERIVRRDPFHK